MDRTTILGGDTFGVHNYTIETDLVDHRVFQKGDTQFLSQELSPFRSMSESKRKQVMAVSAELQDELSQYIREWRKDKLASEDYKTTLLIGEQAV